jgi:hypothetical protein
VPERLAVAGPRAVEENEGGARSRGRWSKGGGGGRGGVARLSPPPACHRPLA